MYAISIRSPLYVTKNHSDLCQILENNYIPVKQIPSQAYFLNIIRAEVRYLSKILLYSRLLFKCIPKAHFTGYVFTNIFLHLETPTMRFRGFDLSTKNLGQGVKQVVQKSHTDLSARMEEIY